jgi:hypothetical protein
LRFSPSHIAQSHLSILYAFKNDGQKSLPKKDDFDVIGKRIPIIKLQQVDASTTFSSPFTESKGRDDPL